MPHRAHSESSERFTLKLSGSLTLSGTPKLRRTIFAGVRKAHGREMELDLSGVGKIDTSGLAVMVETLKAVSAGGGILRFRGVGEDVKRMIRLARLEELFEGKID